MSIDNEKIVYLGYLSYDVPLRYMYYLKTDIDIKDITVQKEEVDYVKYMSTLEIKDLIKSERFLKSHGIIFNETLKKIKNDNNEYDEDLNMKERNQKSKK